MANTNEAATPLEMFETEAKTFSFGPKLDSSGAVRDLSGKTLRFVATDANNVSKVQVDDPDASGDANGMGSVTVSAAKSAAAVSNDHMPYVLWNTTDDEALWNGTLMIRPMLKGT